METRKRKRVYETTLYTVNEEHERPQKKKLVYRYAYKMSFIEMSRQAGFTELSKGVVLTDLKKEKSALACFSTGE